MQVPLRPFLFFALLTTGDSLKCETCNATGTTCTGETKLCPNDENACIVAVIEIVKDGKGQQTAMKGCESSEICNMTPIQLTLGNKTSYSAGVSCCHDDGCHQAFPKLPPIDTKPNGVTCPACFTMGMECSDETVICTGLENFCFEASTTVVNGGKEVSRIIKGCTTQTVCTSVNNGHSPMLDSNTATNAKCYPKPSRGFRTTGLLLPLFSGLLLLKILL